MNKLISIIMTALIIGTVFIMPLSVNATDSAIIDTSKTATLKINKYEIDKDVLKDLQDNEKEKDRIGTGYNSDISKIPTDAKPLAGVTFELRRVVAIDSNGVRYYGSNGAPYSSNIYSVTGSSLPTVEQAKTYKTLNDTGGITNAEAKTAITGSDGVATFDNLPLGIYLVHESKTPSQVVGAVEDFVVSLPITNVEGDGWKYDVEVFPKNATKYEEVTLEKTDYMTGEGIEGAKFNIQYYSETDDGWHNIESQDLESNKYGIVTPSNPLPVKQKYRFIETQAAEGYIYDASNNTSYEFYVDEEGNVCDTTSDHNIIDSDNSHRIKMTNTKPSIEKFIDKSKGNNTDLVKNSAITRGSGNDNYDWFSIKVRTPNIDMSKLETFIVTDAIPGQGGPGAPQVKKIVKEDGTVLPRVVSGSEDNYKVTKSPAYSNTGPYNLTVKFTPSALESNTDYYILVQTDVGQRNVTNTAKLTYSLIANEDKTSTDYPTTAEIQSDTVNLYYFGYKIKKIDGQTGNALQGVEFKLFDSLDDAETLQNELQTETTGSDGIATFRYINVGDTAEDSVELTDSLEWEQGAVNDTTGELSNSNLYIRTKLFDVSLLTKLTYSGTSALHKFYFYDKDNNFISCISGGTSTSNIIDVPNNSEFARMAYGGTGITVSNSSYLESLTGTSYVEGTYYVVETKAKDNYSLLAEPFKITVNNTSYNATGDAIKTVANYEKIAFPFTGGVGIAIFIVVGCLFILTAVIILKKKTNNLKQNKKKG